MKAVVLLAAMIVLGVMTPSASATAPSGASVALGDSASSALSETTQMVTDSTGTYTMTSDAELDTANTTATVAADGYLCGDVQYRATQRAYDFWGIVVWTYRSTFGVHVCHNKVTAKNHLYDEPMDSNVGWSWCGHIQNQFTNNTTSAIGYTKGCFTVLVKGIIQTKYPWASMTIGGNGGLWVRKTGVG